MGFRVCLDKVFGEHEEQSALVCQSCRGMFVLAVQAGEGEGEASSSRPLVAASS